MSKIFKDACSVIYGTYGRNIQRCMWYCLWRIFQKYSMMHVVFTGTYVRNIQKCMLYYWWRIFQAYSKMHVLLSMAHFFGTNRRDLITFKYDIWYYQELIEPFPSKGDYHQQVMRVYRIVIIHVPFPHDTVSRSELNQFEKDGPIWTFAQHRFPADFGFLPASALQSLGFAKLARAWRYHCLWRVSGSLLPLSLINTAFRATARCWMRFWDSHRLWWEWGVIEQKADSFCFFDFSVLFKILESGCFLLRVCSNDFVFRCCLRCFGFSHV